jgi:hypothetical protein
MAHRAIAPGDADMGGGWIDDGRRIDAGREMDARACIAEGLLKAVDGRVAVASGLRIVEKLDGFMGAHDLVHRIPVTIRNPSSNGLASLANTWASPFRVTSRGRVRSQKAVKKETSIS